MCYGVKVLDIFLGFFYCVKGGDCIGIERGMFEMRKL